MALRTFSIISLGAMLLVSCAGAQAENETVSETMIETAKVSRDQCMALATKAEKLDCMKTLKKQRAAEIAILNKEVAKGKATNEALSISQKPISSR